MAMLVFYNAPVIYNSNSLSPIEDYFIYFSICLCRSVLIQTYILVFSLLFTSSVSISIINTSNTRPQFKKNTFANPYVWCMVFPIPYNRQYLLLDENRKLYQGTHKRRKGQVRLSFHTALSAAILYFWTLSALLRPCSAPHRYPIFIIIGWQIWGRLPHSYFSNDYALNAYVITPTAN